MFADDAKVLRDRRKVKRAAKSRSSSTPKRDDDPSDTAPSAAPHALSQHALSPSDLTARARRESLDSTLTDERGAESSRKASDRYLSGQGQTTPTGVIKTDAARRLAGNAPAGYDYIAPIRHEDMSDVMSADRPVLLTNQRLTQTAFASQYFGGAKTATDADQHNWQSATASGVYAGVAPSYDDRYVATGELIL